MPGLRGNDFEALLPGVVTHSDYAMTPEDRVVVAYTDTNAVTVTLPAAPVNGQHAIVKKGCGNARALTIDGNGYLIDGLPSIGTGATIDRVCCHLWFWGGSWHEL
jgi:hypothetical protein